MDDGLPAYTPSAAGTGRREQFKLETLPLDMLLRILDLVPLADVHLGVRPSCRTLRAAALANLRERTLAAFTSRTHFSSDPLARKTCCASSTADTKPSRECEALDLFIAACALEARRELESELLLLPSEECARDLFEFMQPRMRTEDLVAHELLTATARNELLARDLTVELSRRAATVTLPFLSSSGARLVRKQVVETPRESVSEPLERIAGRLARLLKAAPLVRRKSSDGSLYYAWTT